MSPSLLPPFHANTDSVAPSLCDSMAKKPAQPNHNVSTQDASDEARPRYEIESFTTSIHDDDTAFELRRNGKLFYLEISPLDFKNSPKATKKYQRYLAALRGDFVPGDELSDGSISEQDAHDWMLRPFESLLLQLAPDPNPGSARTVTLADYLYAECCVLRLHISKERFRPRAVSTSIPPSRSEPVDLPLHILDQAKTWTRLYRPSEVALSFGNPEDALFKSTKKVLVNDGKTTCFFKESYSTERLASELEAYRRIDAAWLDPGLKVCRLYGIVVADDGSVLGLLLTYIDRACPLTCFEGYDNPSMLTRRMWVSQLELALSELHRAGVVWGNVNTENVLIDGDENAWITELGSIDTPDLIKEGAGTVKGDLKDMERIRDFIENGGFAVE